MLCYIAFIEELEKKYLKSCGKLSIKSTHNLLLNSNKHQKKREFGPLNKAVCKNPWGLPPSPK